MGSVLSVCAQYSVWWLDKCLAVCLQGVSFSVISSWIGMHTTTLFYKNHFYRNHVAKIEQKVKKHLGSIGRLSFK